MHCLRKQNVCGYDRQPESKQHVGYLPCQTEHATHTGNTHFAEQTLATVDDSLWTTTACIHVFEPAVAATDTNRLQILVSHFFTRLCWMCYTCERQSQCKTCSMPLLTVFPVISLTDHCMSQSLQRIDTSPKFVIPWHPVAFPDPVCGSASSTRRLHQVVA